MVSIGAARVVLLLAGLWRAPEETGVRSNLEHGTPLQGDPTMRSQTRRILMPDLSTGEIGGLSNRLTADPLGRGHVRASPNDPSHCSALLEQVNQSRTLFAFIASFCKQRTPGLHELLNFWQSQV